MGVRSLALTVGSFDVRHKLGWIEDFTGVSDDDANSRINGMNAVIGRVLSTNYQGSQGPALVPPDVVANKFSYCIAAQFDWV